MTDIPRYHTIGTLWPENKLPKGHTLGRGPIVLYSDHEASRAKDKARIEALEDTLQDVWSEWRNSPNASDPDAEGYTTLQKVKAVLAAPEVKG